MFWTFKIGYVFNSFRRVPSRSSQSAAEEATTRGKVRVAPTDKPSWINEWHKDETYTIGLNGSRPFPRYWSRYWITTIAPALPEIPTPDNQKPTPGKNVTLTVTASGPGKAYVSSKDEFVGEYDKRSYEKTYTYDVGDTEDLQAYPGSGAELDKWVDADGKNIGKQLKISSVQMDKDKTRKAVFSKKKEFVDVKAGDLGNRVRVTFTNCLMLPLQYNPDPEYHSFYVEVGNLEPGKSYILHATSICESLYVSQLTRSPSMDWDDYIYYEEVTADGRCGPFYVNYGQNVVPPDKNKMTTSDKIIFKLWKGEWKVRDRELILKEGQYVASNTLDIEIWIDNVVEMYESA